MKILRLLFLAVIIPFFLTCCTPEYVGTAERIIPPKNKLIPLSGEWKFQGFKQDSNDNLSLEEAGKLMGKTAVFNEKIAVLGSDSCADPVYKIKNVNSTDYLLYQYKVSPDYLGITSPKIQVVTVTSKNQFFYEFIKTGDGEIIVNIDGTFFNLNKVSDDIDKTYVDRYYENYKETVEPDRFDNGDVVNSGVLIGLRSYKNTNNKFSEKELLYRTLWIPGRNREAGRIYETEGLFVPRKMGFWKLGVKYEKHNGYNQDILFAYPWDKELERQQVEATVEDEKAADIYRTILYVGNDYVSTEYRQGMGTAGDALFKVLPIDNIENAKAVKISDIAGEAGRLALSDGISRYFTSNRWDKDSYFNIKPDEESFAVVRRNGHWVMKGRLNSLNEKSSFIDFNIKAIPPSSLVTYDGLCLSWSGVKERIPEAVDMYTSPNFDIAVIMTNNYILVYAIEGKELSQKPLRKIRLKDKETVVMAEWSSGRYTDKWEKEFLKNKTSEIKE